MSRCLGVLVPRPPHSPCMKPPFFTVWKCRGPRFTPTLRSASCITDPCAVLVSAPLLSRLLQAARGVPMTFALLVLCVSRLLCGSRASLASRSVGSSFKNALTFLVQLSCGDLLLCPSCRRGSWVWLRSRRWPWLSCSGGDR